MDGSNTFDLQADQKHSQGGGLAVNRFYSWSFRCRVTLAYLTEWPGL